MSKSAMVRARLEPSLKDHAETIFHRLGLNATQAITLFQNFVTGSLLTWRYPHQRQNKHLKILMQDGLIACENADDMLNKIGI